MEGNGNGDGGLFPALALIQPLLCGLVLQLAELTVHHRPLCVTNIFGIKILIPNDAEEPLEAIFTLKGTLVPVPLPKKHGTLVRVRVEWVVTSGRFVNLHMFACEFIEHGIVTRQGPDIVNAEETEGIALRFEQCMRRNWEA